MKETLKKNLNVQGKYIFCSSNPVTSAQNDKLIFGQRWVTQWVFGVKMIRLK